MRIVNKQEFYLLPEGTLFSVYIPQMICDLKIKGETCYKDNGRPFDYFETNIIDSIECDDSEDRYEKLDAAKNDSSVSLKLDFECEGRDGMFDEGQMYAVYESDDIKSLISRLQTCIGA